MTARKIGFVSAAATVILMAWHHPAFAYLDPGTGSMILQGIIGAVVGGLIALKLYWARVKQFFSSRRPGRTPSTGTVADQDPDDK